jgi:prepilin-type N-terminal cleavage/methylation domain-containing protein
MTHHVKHQQGFTLIELMIALAFVAFILIFSTTAVIQVMQTYNKGLAIKNINQAGRTTMEDMTRYLRTADPGVVDVSLVSSQRRACFGGISYVWNLSNTPANLANKFSGSTDTLTFVRVEDESKAMCKATSGAYPDVPKAQATDILQSNVWVMSVAMTAPGVGAPLMDLTLNLAVANDPAISSGQCAQGGTTGQFCATSNFTTTVMTGGGN